MTAHMVETVCWGVAIVLLIAAYVRWNPWIALLAVPIGIAPAARDSLLRASREEDA